MIYLLLHPTVATGCLEAPHGLQLNKVATLLWEAPRLLGAY